MRPYFQYINKKFKLTTITGVEVGVKKGDNALQVINTLPTLSLLYLVDKWKAYSKDIALPTEQQAGYLKQTQFDRWKWEAQYKLSKYSNITFLEMDSILAAKYLINENIKVDFVYIDATHVYDLVLKDCNAWLPVIKSNGVIGGHDFNNPAAFVADAVKTFAASIDKELLFEGEDWWIQL